MEEYILKAMDAFRDRFALISYSQHGLIIEKAQRTCWRIFQA